MQTASSVGIQWASVKGASEYSVRYSASVVDADTDESSAVEAIEVRVDADTNEFRAEGLEPSTLYTFEVSASNEAGDSGRTSTSVYTGYLLHFLQDYYFI